VAITEAHASLGKLGAEGGLVMCFGRINLGDWAIARVCSSAISRGYKPLGSRFDTLLRPACSLSPLPMLSIPRRCSVSLGPSLIRHPPRPMHVLACRPAGCPDIFPLPRPSPPHPRRNCSPCPDSGLFGSSDQPLPRIVRPPVPLAVPRQLLCILFFLTSFTSRSIAPLPWEDGDMHADRDPGTRCRCPCRLRGKLRLTRSA
jgi:hypothetical protein